MMSLFDSLWSAKKYGSLSANDEDDDGGQTAYKPLLDKSVESRETTLSAKKPAARQQRTYLFDSSRPADSNTKEYVVKESDTLVRIAARFWTTPTFIKKLNKLSTNHVFAGQVLLVPDTKSGPKAGK